MKKILALLLAMLMLMMGLAACGETADAPDTPEEDPGPSINYEDYVKPVVDRRVEDLITPEELSAIMTVDVTPIVTTDSSVTAMAGLGEDQGLVRRQEGYVLKFKSLELWGALKSRFS